MKSAPALLLLCGLTMACAPAPLDEERMVFYSFDDLLVGRWSGGALDLKRVPLGLKLDSIGAVRSDGGVIHLLGRRTSSAEAQAIIFRYTGEGWTEIFGDRIQAFAVDPTGRFLAFTSPAVNSNETYDVRIYDLSSGESRLVVRGQADYGTLLAWHPTGSLLTFESSDGWLRSIEIVSGSTSDWVRGAAPAWSADGSLLAYRQSEDRLALYRPASGESTLLIRRRFWQSGLVGPIYWHQDGTYVSVNAFSGLTGKKLRCLVSDVRTAETFSVYEGHAWCGPWLGSIDLH